MGIEREPRLFGSRWHVYGIAPTVITLNSNFLQPYWVLSGRYLAEEALDLAAQISIDAGDRL